MNEGLHTRQAGFWPVQFGGRRRAYRYGQNPVAFLNGFDAWVERYRLPQKAVGAAALFPFVYKDPMGMALLGLIVGGVSAVRSGLRSIKH